MSVAEGSEAAPGCRHSWIIEPAKGPVSEGVCQLCQETREFKNSISDIERDSLDLTAYSQVETSGYMAAMY